MPLRIAQIAPIVERVPPQKYGGTERVVSALTEELVKRGHRVTLFATGDSKTSAGLVSITPHALREDNIPNLYEANEWTVRHIAHAYAQQGKFDIIHDHLGPLSLPTAQTATTPTVITMHGSFSPENLGLFTRYQKPFVVALSRSHAALAKGVNLAGFVYNGLAMEHYPFSKNDDDYLLLVGRISSTKGVHLAIEVAKRDGLPLIIAAKLEPIDEPYFKTSVEPGLDGQIRWIGEVNEEARNKLYARATAFLYPVMWPEPFGLSLIEAMACGCPVVAFNKGAIPEIIRDGETGFVVSTTDEMASAIRRIHTIDRTHCRTYALSTFTVERMADGYERIYRAILSRHAV